MSTLPPEITETDLSVLSDAELAAAFNAVYAEYIVPFRMDEGAARQHMDAYAITRDRSILWRDGAGAIVALGALGVRGDRGWVGGFGLATPWRGRGLAGPLMARLLNRAREDGLRRVQLEVITSNERAIRTYERAGFRKTRDLLILAADPAAVTGAVPERLREVDASPLLADPPFSSVAPCWQSEPASLATKPELQGVILGAPETPRAYALVADRGTAATVYALAGESAAALDALVAALRAHSPDRGLRIGNEPEGSPTAAALLRAGWRETLRQHEMVRNL